MTPTPLDLVIAAITAWLAIGALGLLRPRDLHFVSRVLFPAGAAIAVALTVVAGYAVGQPPQSSVLPLGLPDLPFHLRVDSLSAFFLCAARRDVGRDIAVLVGLLPLERGHRAGPASRCSTTRSSRRWRWC